MPATLCVKSGDESREYSCGQLLTIGRTDQNDIVLQDPKVSRNHAILRFLGDGKYYIIDMGSANGTFVNGNRIVVPYALSDSNEIRIGDHTAVFRYQPQTIDTARKDESVNIQKTLLTFGGAVHRITVMVADIRNYTAMSEDISVDLLATMLGCWFRAANEIVEKNGGVVDKFIGDAVMVRWLTDARGSNKSVVAALRTAHDLKLASDAVSKDFPNPPHALRIGVGINTGQAVLGNIGADSRRDYTAFGDSVNLAFHLESASKTLKTDVVLGQDSYKHLPKELWEDKLQSVAVKGKEEPITVCALTFEQTAAWLAQITR